jgi:ligand-binding sensor domain-containing protein
MAAQDDCGHMLLLFYLTLFLYAAPAYALDPGKRLTQYLHHSWRIQDGSLPAAGNSITQTSDGFLWLGAGSEGLYRFDGVRFVPWPIPIKDKAIKAITNIYGDHSGGLWVLGEA